MAPGKKDSKDEDLLLALMPVETKEAESEKQRNIVCVVATDAEKITINLDRRTTVMKFYKIVADKANYVLDTFVLLFLKASTDGKSSEEVLLQNSHDTTLDKVVGNANSKPKHFVVKSKDGTGPVKRIQQATENSDESDAPESVMSSLFEKETSFSTTTNEQIKGISFSKSESGFVGLINQAMTCYLNSLIQTLFMTPEFRNALYRWKYTGTEQAASKSIPFQLQKLFLKLQVSKKKAVETTDLTKSFGWDSSEAWQQHDVQELCRVMFDALEETLKDTDQADLINQIYQGKMKDYVKCLKCSHESARNDTYLDIPLAIRPFGAKESYHSIEEAFAGFTTPEVLDGNNQYFCEKCSSKQDAHKGLKFLTLPYCLTIQLKRFSYDYNTGQRIKLHDRVTFPERIKMSDFIHNDEFQTSKASQPQNFSSSCKETVINGDEKCRDSCDAESASILKSEDNENGAAERPSEIYELFSIMIHSGNALGGHYYAYIKSFADDRWYCFNDQHVYEISKKELEKSYGGLDTSCRGYYSATYSSSTNAYMLMYRRKDTDYNVTFDAPSQWPEHMIELREKLIREEDDEIDRKSKDRDLCKIRLFCEHPRTGKWIETKLHVEQSKTLKETTEIAWRLLGLEGVIGVERCRIVKYDDNYGSYERSFDGEDSKEIGVLLGGVKYSYAFDLLLETKNENEQFPVYETGGTTIRVYNVNLKESKVEDPMVLHASKSYTVKDLKKAIEEEFQLPAKHMRVVVGKDYHDFRLLTESDKTLKSEGLYKSAKVFVESSGGADSKLAFKESDFAKVLDLYSNTIKLNVVLPFANMKKKGQNEIVLKIDKRKTLADFKQMVSIEIDVDADNFRVYRVYSNNQEMEVIKLSDQLIAYCDDTKLIIKIGRALKFGESRIKLYLLRPNDDEHTKFLMEAVVSEDVRIWDIKADIVKELKGTLDIDTTEERIRIRKKSWKNPSTIYMDSSVFEKDIRLGTSAEFFVEIVEEAHQKTSTGTLMVYTRRWRPSKYQIDSFEEVMLEDRTVKAFISKVAELSGLPEDRIEIAKGKGYFPYESSLLEIGTELDWNPDVCNLSEYPLTIADDGSLIYYRDKEEKKGDLSEEKKKEIKERERQRSQKSSTSFQRKEKALKIYTNKA